MAVKPKLQPNYLSLLSLEVDKMHEKPLNLNYLIRKVRPFCKTTRIGGRFSILLKGTDFRVLLNLQDISGNLHFFRVKSSKCQTIDYTICADSSKELLQKLIYKFQFFE